MQATCTRGLISPQLWWKEKHSHAQLDLIREGKTHQIQTSIQTGTKFGMQTMDSDLTNLYLKGIISKEVLLTYAVDKDIVSRYI